MLLDCCWVNLLCVTKEHSSITLLNVGFSYITGFYFYIEASGRSIGDVATLVSPYIQSNGNATCMVFYYHLYGQSIGTLRVKVGDQVMWKLSGNQGNDWYKGTVPLNFNATYRVRQFYFLQ